MRTRQKRAYSRGYDYEYTLTELFREFGWHAKRLGGASIHIPDIVSTWRHNAKVGDKRVPFDYMVSLEAKSTGKDRVEIPRKEIERTFDWFKMFPLYDDYNFRHKHVVFAYKFLSTKASEIKVEGIKRRPVKEYYQIFKLTEDPPTYLARELLKDIIGAYCHYEHGPKLVFKDNERNEYMNELTKNKIVKTVTTFVEMIDTILFEC